jgi:hypothetical protein
MVKTSLEGERAGEGERGYVWYRKYLRYVKKGTKL